MKLKRAKAYKKLMGYLQLNFGFRLPYQVLVDEELLLTCAASKYDLQKGLERTLQGPVKVLVTQCVIEHLYRAKTNEAKDAIATAKTFERRRCGHVPPNSETLSAYECIRECVGPGNKHRYVVATQKPKLRALFRTVPGIPLIYMNRSVMVMEPMSKATVEARNAIESAKLTQGLNQVSRHEEEGRVHKKRSAKQPNPLSVKKKQKVSEEKSTSKRRKRGRGSGDNGDQNGNQETDQSVPTATADADEGSD